MMTAAAVASAGIATLGANAITIPGFMNRLVYYLVRLLPRAVVTRLAGKLIRSVDKSA